MRTITVSEEQGNKRIDRILKDVFRNLPSSALYKAFRKKDVKVNGKRVKEEYIAVAGDIVEIYIIDDILYGAPNPENFKLNKGFSVVYEDANILIVNKEQGIAVHPDKEQTDNTLIDQVKLYIQEKGEYNPQNPSSFVPALCHRLDRNTGGLVIIGKSNESLKEMLNKIKSKEVRKYYQCLVKGKMEKQSAELKAYLKKDERKSRVFISSEASRKSLEIITRYRVISYEDDISRLEVELVTGRTHQIRAHLAFIGHPIIGDGKYGTNAINRPLGAKFQALWAYKIEFDFKTNAGILNYLKGKEFEVEPSFRLR